MLMQRATIIDDYPLRQALASRNHSALRQIIADHGSRLHRIAYRMLQDQAEAEDITQETLIKLWQLGEKIAEPDFRIGPWLNRVITNACLDRIRRRKPQAGIEQLAEVADRSPTPEATLLANDQETWVKAAIASLPERQRAAIILTHYEDCSNQEGAAILAMNIKAFESLLRRARVALQQMAHIEMDQS